MKKVIYFFSMISIFRSKTGLPRQEKAYSPYSFVNRRFEICSSVSLSRRGIRSAPVSGRGEHAAFSLKGQHFWHSSHPKISGVLRRIFFSSSFKTSFFCVRYDLHRHGLNRSWESAFPGHAAKQRVQLPQFIASGVSGGSAKVVSMAPMVK